MCAVARGTPWRMKAASRTRAFPAVVGSWTDRTTPANMHGRTYAQSPSHAVPGNLNACGKAVVGLFRHLKVHIIVVRYSHMS